MEITTVFVLLWFAIGLYALLANVERVPRVYGLPSNFGHTQHILTLLLGPVGLLLVMRSGGRWKFWSEG